MGAAQTSHNTSCALHPLTKSAVARSCVHELEKVWIFQQSLGATHQAIKRVQQVHLDHGGLPVLVPPINQDRLAHTHCTAWTGACGCSSNQPFDSGFPSKATTNMAYNTQCSLGPYCGQYRHVTCSCAHEFTRAHSERPSPL